MKQNLPHRIRALYSRSITYVCKACTFVPALFACLKGALPRVSAVHILSFTAPLVCLLLVGFVSNLPQTEVRRRLITTLHVTLPAPITRPMSHITSHVRELYNPAPLSTSELTQNPFWQDNNTDQPLVFAGDSVSMLLDKGPVVLELALQGAFMQSLTGNAHTLENLNHTIQKVHVQPAILWNNAMQRCEPTLEGEKVLLSNLKKWEKQQNTFVYRMRKLAKPFKRTVERYAAQFKLPKELVYAIMHTESGFNPTLISHRNAHGLMQIVPTTAGNEVNSWLGRKGQPSRAELLEPHTNILYGTTYLHLLLTRHLRNINDKTSREYCAIAAYNIGSSNMLKVFGKDWPTAFKAINALTPQEVKQALLAKLPAKETQVFLTRVLSMRDHFSLAGYTP